MENEVRPIDANAMIEDITAAGENAGMGAVVAGALRRYVDRRQTIDPESLRPKGRWKYDECNLEWACSECLCTAHVNLGAISGYILSDFCPNCGAKMEG